MLHVLRNGAHPSAIDQESFLGRAARGSACFKRDSGGAARKKRADCRRQTQAAASSSSRNPILTCT
jgi:hypothetical protein